MTSENNYDFILNDPDPNGISDLIIGRAKYYQKNISNSDMQKFFDATKPSEESLSELYKITKNLGNLKSLFTRDLFDDKDKLDKLLDEIFSLIIESGTAQYKSEKRHNKDLNATNFLKQDKNYYLILETFWNMTLKEKITSIFKEYLEE